MFFIQLTIFYGFVFSSRPLQPYSLSPTVLFLSLASPSHDQASLPEAFRSLSPRRPQKSSGCASLKVPLDPPFKARPSCAHPSGRHLPLLVMFRKNLPPSFIFHTDLPPQTLFAALFYPKLLSRLWSEFLVTSPPNLMFLLVDQFSVPICLMAFHFPPKEE